MASRTYKDAGGATQQALTHRDAANANDIPLYKLGYGADLADPTVVTASAGLPTRGQRTVGSPTTAKIASGTASTSGNANAVAIGGTGGSAVPGIFVFTADPDNAALIVIGDTNINATARSGATNYVRGLPLQPGQAYVIDTDDLRSWKMSVRTANDGGTYVQVG